jgi:hypothetical protein
MGQILVAQAELLRDCSWCDGTSRAGQLGGDVGLVQAVLSFVACRCGLGLGVDLDCVLC